MTDHVPTATRMVKGDAQSGQKAKVEPTLGDGAQTMHTTEGKITAMLSTEKISPKMIKLINTLVVEAISSCRKIQLVQRPSATQGIAAVPGNATASLQKCSNAAPILNTLSTGVGFRVTSATQSRTTCDCYDGEHFLVTSCPVAGPMCHTSTHNAVYFHCAI